MTYKQTQTIAEKVVPYLFIIAVFYIMAFGIALTIGADLGVGSWSVFQIGVSRHLPITIGQASQGVGLAVILIAWALGIRPTMATVLNMLLIGYFIDIHLSYLAGLSTDSFVLKLTMLVAGVVVLGTGSGAYMSTHLGTGPRDGLLMAIVGKSRFSVGIVRTSIELVVLVLGFLLGGPVGIGTIIFSLIIGWVQQFSLKFFGHLRSQPGFAIFFNGRGKIAETV